MTSFLTKITVGRSPDYTSVEVRSKLTTLASITGIVVNVFLFALKLTAGLLAASIAVIADAFNNVSDAGSAVIAFIGFRLAAKPVDKEHPLGHGRMEYITGFIVDMLIILVGFELFKSSVQKIASPTPVQANALTFILLGIAIPFKLWLFFFYRNIAKKISSPSLKGAALDSVSDTAATSLVLISTIIAKTTGVSIDGWVGVLVAIFILFAGVKAAKETVDLLLGSPPKKEFIDELSAFALSYPEIVGVHDVMAHDYGPGRQFVSFHAEVPSGCDVAAAHDVIDCIERDMERKFGCIVTIHMDPIETDNELVNEMRTFAEQAAKSVDERFLIHDFRLTYGGKHTNLIFDLCIPTDSKLSKEEAAKRVSELISEQKPDCFAVIKPEHPYV